MIGKNLITVLFMSLVKEFQGDPSDGSEKYELEGSGQENSLRSY